MKKRGLFLKSYKANASSLMETIFAMVLIVICMGISVSLLVSINRNITRINDVQVTQNLFVIQKQLQKGHELNLDGQPVFKYELDEGVQEAGLKIYKLTISKNNELYDQVDFFCNQ